MKFTRLIALTLLNFSMIACGSAPHGDSDSDNAALAHSATGGQKQAVLNLDIPSDEALDKLDPATVDNDDISSLANMPEDAGKLGIDKNYAGKIVILKDADKTIVLDKATQIVTAYKNDGTKEVLPVVGIDPKDPRIDPNGLAVKKNDNLPAWAGSETRKTYVYGYGSPGPYTGAICRNSCATAASLGCATATYLCYYYGALTINNCTLPCTVFALACEHKAWGVQQCQNWCTYEFGY